jgi:hypothetical protein
MNVQNGSDKFTFSNCACLIPSMIPLKGASRHINLTKNLRFLELIMEI